ncbi:hypothetical protein B0H65DRAFT_450330 [Neurospora tetraspora]|uniref:Uncharacterized protein n=1 Tax=Neurospora tetraspora TaxID=94610 RepID=A0AAE0JQ47_9PEZI|nr:hypothetical protein B0H65DRAFT_450330 [Neurospora tetraspora]
MCLESTETTISTGQCRPVCSHMQRQSVSRDLIRDITSSALGGENRPVTYRGARCVAANGSSKQSQWTPQNTIDPYPHTSSHSPSTPNRSDGKIDQDRPEAGETSLSIGVGTTTNASNGRALKETKTEWDALAKSTVRALICQRCALCVMTSFLDPIIVQAPNRPGPRDNERYVGRGNCDVVV